MLGPAGVASHRRAASRGTVVMLVSGSASTISPPRTRHKPASLFRGVRSGCFEDKVQMVESGSLVPLVPAWCGPLGLAFGCPSHIPTEGLLVGPTPDRARARVNVFRKIHLYGKTKKSTHGHTNPKPFCTRFFQSLHARRAGSREHNDTRQPFQRRPGRALRRVEVAALG